MNVIQIIENKLDIIYALIKQVAFQENKYGSTMRFVNRNLYGKFYTNELLRELTIINSYFIIYENQVKHLVKQKEISNTEDYNTLKWATIYEDETVKTYLGINKPTPPVGETENKSNEHKLNTPQGISNV
jgi:hypothetical protein